MPSIACSASIFTPLPCLRRSGAPHAGRRAHYCHRLGQWRSHASAGNGGLCGQQIGPAGLARGSARDFGPRGITVNVVQPGPIDTDANPENGPMKELMHSFMAIAPWPSGRGGGNGGVAGRSGGVVCHWRHAHHRRSVWRLIPQGGDARFAPPPRGRHRLSGIFRPLSTAIKSDLR